MGFIDGTVVSLAMPVIRADLGASLVDAQWISNSYMLFLSALVLIGGAAGDVFGVRNIFAAGIVLFMLTSALCAVAPSADLLILARGAQGIGAALMVPGSLAIIAKAYPGSERGQAIGTWAAFSSLTTAMGPFIGGMVLSFGEPWMWRVIFAINAPIGLVALAMLWTKVPRDRPVSKRRLDIPGALLATLSLGVMAWALTGFGLPAGQQGLPPMLSLAIGILLFLAFIWLEGRIKSPMVKLELFRSKAFSGANLYTLLLFFGLNAVVFFLPMTVISAWGAKEWQASLLFVPLSVAIALLSARMGRLADRIGPRLPLTLGAGLVALAFLALALTMPLMMLWTVTFPILVLQGIGMAILVSPLSAAVMRATSDEDTGLASGVNNAVARAAGLMAVAALGAVAGLVFAAVMGGPATGVEFGVVPTAGLDAGMEALRIGATNRAFQAIALISAAMSGAAAIIGWLTQPAKRETKPAGSGEKAIAS
jgi:EmrB/QacA subfamily drug resistance transporter